MVILARPLIVILVGVLIDILVRVLIDTAFVSHGLVFALHMLAQRKAIGTLRATLAAFHRAIFVTSIR